MESFYPTILRMLRDKSPFAFSRFGDGEFNAIFGKAGANCDGHTYFPDLGVELRRILESHPKYFVGLQRMVRRARAGQPEFERLITACNVLDCDCLHHASINENLVEFFDTLAKRDCVLVGPDHLMRLKEVTKRYQILIPSRNCWLDRKRIVDACKRELRRDTVALFCASMATKPIIHELQPQFPDSTFVDVGSVFDRFVGVKSRSYMRAKQ